MTHQNRLTSRVRVLGWPFIFLLLSAGFCCSASGSQDDWRRQRRQMVEDQLESRDITNRRVLEAMGKVPRHELVPAEVRHLAYADHPLPIGLGQTISQPYIVALMTQVARPRPEHRALEVGTGSGYQAAVLAELVKEVYTIEIVPDLASRATRDLERLGYENVTVREGDGYAGWPEQAPFDIVLITAAAETIPQPLLDQLADKGRLVMPLGPIGGVQTLIVVQRNGDRFAEKRITPVRFVPMTGKVREKKPE